MELWSPAVLKYRQLKYSVKEVNEFMFMVIIILKAIQGKSLKYFIFIVFLLSSFQCQKSTVKKFKLFFHHTCTCGQTCTCVWSPFMVGLSQNWNSGALRSGCDDATRSVLILCTTHLPHCDLTSTR